MLSQSVLTLVNPANGNPGFRYMEFEDNSYFDHIQRDSYFSLIWVIEGGGSLKADFAEYDFIAGSLFAFSPRQPYMFTTDKPIKGIAIYFRPDFFCIYKHHKEVTANGILYNDIYQPPFVTLDAATAAIFQTLCSQIKSEMQNAELAQYELLVSYLKILLINAARLKTQQQSKTTEIKGDHKEPFILQI